MGTHCLPTYPNLVMREASTSGFCWKISASANSMVRIYPGGRPRFLGFEVYVQALLPTSTAQSAALTIRDLGATGRLGSC